MNTLSEIEMGLTQSELETAAKNCEELMTDVVIASQCKLIMIAFE